MERMASPQRVGAALAEVVVPQEELTQEHVERRMQQISLVMGKKGKSAKETLEALRGLYVLQLSAPGLLPMPMSLATEIVNLLLDENASAKLRVLCLSFSKQLSNTDPELLLSRTQNSTAATSKKGAGSHLSLLPLIVALAEDSTVARMLPSVVRWVVGQDSTMRSTAFTSLSLLGRRVELQRNYMQPVEKQMMDWLLHAKDASEHTSGVRFFGLGSSHAAVVTEIDGSPAQSFFTVLNNTGQYSEEQSFNVLSFSSLHSWLCQQYHSSLQQQQSKRRLEPSFEEGIIKYCLRIIEQSKLKPMSKGTSGSGAGGSGGVGLGGIGTVGSAGGVASEVAARVSLAKSSQQQHKEELPQIALAEAIRILDVICKLNPSQVPQLLPLVKKIFDRESGRTNGHVFVAVLQFLTNHSESAVYDPEPIFRCFFEQYLSTHYNNSFVSFETMNFFLENKIQLLQCTNIFTVYFPPIFKLFAWSPFSVFRYTFSLLLLSLCAFLEVITSTFIQSEFAELLPAMIGPSTYLEIFHSLLDLPLLAAALERIQCLTSMEGSEYDEATNEYRVLYNYILRNESGVSINFWKSSTTFGLLQEFCRNTTSTPRVVAVAQAVPVLLSIFFDVLLSYASPEPEPSSFPSSSSNNNNNAVAATSKTSSVFASLLPDMFERIEQLFPLEEFQGTVRKELVRRAMEMFRASPFLVAIHQDLIVGIITDPPSQHPARQELVLQLCWAVGEYASPALTSFCTQNIIYDYHTALETFAYERMALQQQPASSSFPGKKAGAALYTTRLMLVVLSSLSKLAARWQDLAARVVLCLAKVLQKKEVFHPSVVQRAEECLHILKFPSIASAILDSPQRGAKEEEQLYTSPHADKTSSLPFLLFPTTMQPANYLPDGGLMVSPFPIHPFELSS
ncbi:hypothetical protein QOT17_002464 [Balamuthia mandrillaris]